MIIILDTVNCIIQVTNNDQRSNQHKAGILWYQLPAKLKEEPSWVKSFTQGLNRSKCNLLDLCSVSRSTNALNKLLSLTYIHVV